MLPEHRFYPAEGQDMNDTAIHTTGLRDLYLALGDDRGGGRFAVRAYVSPLAPLIWLGGLVMALGGALSLWGRLRLKEPDAQPAAPAVAAGSGMKTVIALLLMMVPALAAGSFRMRPPRAARRVRKLFPIRRWKRAPAICSASCAA